MNEAKIVVFFINDSNTVILSCNTFKYLFSGQKN